MSFKPAIVFFSLLSFIVLSASQETPSGARQAAIAQANMANTAETAQFRRFSSADDARALQADIRRMRTLVGQMQTNLAFVDTTQSPLKHQFQLQIDAWNILIDQMERRAQTTSH